MHLMLLTGEDFYFKDSITEQEAYSWEVTLFAYRALKYHALRVTVTLEYSQIPPQI